MILQQLYLRSFRNYTEANINFESGVNIILGPNGWGKTNLLEAIFLVAVGRDPWTSPTDELVYFGSESAFLKALWEKNDTIELRIIKGNAKEISLNGKRVKKLSELIGLFPVAMAGPQEVELVRGSPKVRRRMLDLHLSQLTYEYLENLSRFQAYLKGRNKVLKEFQEGLEPPGGAVYLDVWDEKFVEYGVKVMTERSKFIGALSPICEEIYREIAGENVRFELKYEPGLQAGVDELTYDSFLAFVKDNRQRELKMGESLFGPQRDDFKVFVDGRDLRVFGSWGECRSASLAIVLGIARLLEKKFSSSPVVILDDCFANLDIQRIKNLLNLISGVGQIFASTPFESDLVFSFSKKIFRLVAPGKLIEEK